MKRLHVAQSPVRAALGAALLSAPLVLTGLTGTAEAAVGTPTPADTLTHTVQLSIGEWPENRGCTGTVVDELWLATAASCFAERPGEAVPVGKPARKTTVTLTGGTVRNVVELAPRADRDLVLARLDLPAQGITPVKLSTTAPAAGKQVSASGFGRTKTVWVPDRLHSAAFVVTSATGGDLALDSANGTDVLCKGDTGGPVLDAAGNLVGVNSRSWQGGCLGAPATETRTGAVAARTDDLASWIESVKQRPVVLRGGETLRSGETISSANAKLIMQTNGDLVIYHRTGGENRGGALWVSGTSGNPGAYAKMQADGNFVVYKKDGSEADPSSVLWASKTYGHAGARMTLQANGNLSVHYTSTTTDGSAGVSKLLWQSDTSSRGDKLTSGAKLMPGSWLTNGQTVLMMDIQGNVLLREAASGRELWGKYSWNWQSYLHMQADGSLVLYAKDGGQGRGGNLWATESWNGAGAYAALEGSALVVRAQDGGTRWASSTFRGAQSGRCLDWNGTTGAMIWDCWGGANQQWDATAAKELRVGGDKCLTADKGANQGARVSVQPCDGSAEQKWNVNADTTITAVLNPGQCMNAWGQATANGSTLGLWGCDGGANTKWARP
ncbi:trypsin-like serine protease [Streptomyces sp. QHH-9511]|uniref:trypsin-like serine protease n=1 Tax=Streptomyces sp. QHH-9511 TaxID=2684468 RepID=UPI0013168C6E|nr:trypsin-like serine protease [Streptomyces sp. QHH-9511]QGZ52484.1 trypsin-like serine protease [Streptomyces sp. QHH-9511]